MFEHGSFVVRQIDNILFCRLTGSFNKEGIEGYINEIKHCFNNSEGTPLGMLIDNLAFEGGTPDAYQVFEQYNQWLNYQPIVGKAFIVNSIMTKEIMLKQSPALRKQNIDFFNEEEDALTWLRAQF